VIIFTPGRFIPRERSSDSLSVKNAVAGVEKVTIAKILV
jgi:hypothetical protein